jgi:hypothetical protein
MTEFDLPGKTILMQMMALGEVGSLAEGCEVVRRSFDLAVYEPGRREGWEEAYARLLAVMQRVG